MKTRILIFFSVLMGAFLLSCSKSKNSNIILTATNYTAALSGASETPPDTSKAVGVANFVFNPATQTLSGNVTFAGINPTEAHIHKGAAGVAGNVVFSLGNAPFTSPITFTSPVLTQNQIYDLTSGLYYVNLHSAQFPNGEIRGQLVKSSSSGK